MLLKFLKYERINALAPQIIAWIVPMIAKIIENPIDWISAKWNGYTIDSA